MTIHSESLRFPARPLEGASGVLNRVTSQEAGWDLLNMEVRRLVAGESWSGETGDCEAAIVVLGGRCNVQSNRGQWSEVGRRATVFSGMPHALYLPRHSDFRIQATSEVLELAWCWVPTDQDHPARLVRPEDCKTELRGGHNASRQINSILPPGFGCHRIVCVEVYTPHGNWSSYPPHKHDEHRVDDSGNLLEADLEEFYYYKIDRPEGYALQRIYTDSRSIDETVAAHDNDIVLVPEGYHPVSAAYGYNCYYLNFLAGTAQSLACTDDPTYAWTKETWDQLDSRVPMVSHEMEPCPST
jgi:5-deoxy-glucuronate isomerase